MSRNELLTPHLCKKASELGRHKDLAAVAVA